MKIMKKKKEKKKRKKKEEDDGDSDEALGVQTALPSKANYEGFCPPVGAQ
jgi:hypothetical protein